MGLKEVILEIAEEMEEVRKEYMRAGVCMGGVVAGWAKQLQRAVRAAGDSPDSPPVFPSAAAQHAAMIEAAKAEFRQKKITEAEEISDRYLPCEGGMADGALTPVPSDMPEGAKTLLGDCVYVMERGLLVYSEEESKKLKTPP